MTAQLFSNNAISLLQLAVSPSSLTITVQPGLGSVFPNPGPGEFFLVTLEDIAAPNTREIIKIDSRTGDVLHIAARGQEGTPILSWPAANTLVDHRITAATIADAFANPPIPTQVSAFTNDAGYITHVDLPAALLHPVKTITANYTATQNDYYLGVNTSLTAITITLPALLPGSTIVVKDESGLCATHNITILGNIDNTSLATLAINNASLTFIYNNGWRII